MKRPLAVTILAFVYIGVGAIGFVAHFTDLLSMDASRYDGLWIELTEILAVLCGAFMFRGQNWARWLAVAWIAFHVILSALQPVELAIHSLFCALIVWLLFRADAARYFRSRVTVKARPPIIEK
jgi:hypothetical protein